MIATDASIINVYEKVLNGDLKHFPPYTWENRNSLYYAKVLTKYLFEKKLVWTLDDIKQKFSVKIISDYKLSGMKKALFKSFFEIIDNAYPNQILPWELHSTPKGFWKSDKNRMKALKWLFEGKMNGDLDVIKKNLSKETFKNYGLEGLLKLFNFSPYNALNFYYPNKVKPWELKYVPKNFWESDEHKKEALNWLFHEKLNWSCEDIEHKLNRNVFHEYKLDALFFDYFKGSPYFAAKFLYPDKEFKDLLKRKKKHGKKN